MFWGCGNKVPQMGHSAFTLETGIQVSAGWFLLRPLFWARGWPTPPYVLIWSSLCISVS